MPDSDQGPLFADAVRRLDHAFEYAHVDEEVIEKLKHPKLIKKIDEKTGDITVEL